MGNCVGGFKRRTRISPWKSNHLIVICFLGIDGSGKTTIVKALQGEDFGTVHSTVGFSRAEFNLKKYKILAYDLGGGERIREIWPTYYAEIYGLIYVVDSAAASRMAENRRMVDTLVGRPDLIGKPILFLLNKKDLPEPIDEMQFSDKFELHNMAKINKADIRVEGICAVKGTGKEIDLVIVEGIEWLIERIQDNYTNIEKGVAAALKTLQERQAQDRLERQHRLAIIAATKAEEGRNSENASLKSGGNLVEDVLTPIPNGIATHLTESTPTKEVFEEEEKVPNNSATVHIQTKNESLQNDNGNKTIEHPFKNRVSPLVTQNSLPSTSALDNMNYSGFELKHSNEPNINRMAFSNESFQAENELKNALTKNESTQIRTTTSSSDSNNIIETIVKLPDKLVPNEDDELVPATSNFEESNENILLHKELELFNEKEKTT